MNIFSNLNLHCDEFFFVIFFCSWRGIFLMDPGGGLFKFFLMGVNVVGQCGGIPVNQILIRIGVLPQSHRVRVMFC